MLSAYTKLQQEELREVSNIPDEPTEMTRAGAEKYLPRKIDVKVLANITATMPYVMVARYA